MQLADGYVTYRRSAYNVNIAEICGIDETSDLCWRLAKAGISAGTVTFLVLLSLIVSTIALTARPTFSTTTGLPVK